MAGQPTNWYKNDGTSTYETISFASAPDIDNSAFSWSRDGYTFLYWNTSADGSGTTYEVGDSIVSETTGDYTFYAIWQVASITQYLTNETDLTSVANAIRSKGGTSESIVYPSGYVNAINALKVASPLWLPPSATLVASATETINLSADTSYDSWTPTTTNTSILAAGTSLGACSYTVTDDDVANVAVMGIEFAYVDYAYADGTTFAKGYPVYGMLMGVVHWTPFQILDYGDANRTYTFDDFDAHKYYWSSTKAKSIQWAATYGVGPTAFAPTASSETSATSRTYGWTRPTIYARCNSTYFSTAAAGALDSANTNITFKYLMYTIPKEECVFRAVFDANIGILYQGGS